MATENTKTFTKVIKGKKWVLPRVSELPFDAIDLIFELDKKREAAKDENGQIRIAFETVKQLKEYVPALVEAGKILNTKEIISLISSWFNNEKKITGSEVGK